MFQYAVGTVDDDFWLGEHLWCTSGRLAGRRFDYKKIFVASIVLNGVLSIIFASHITYVTAVGIWLLMAVDVLVMNYPCHIKIVRMLASDADQGKIFGMMSPLMESPVRS